MAKDAKAAATTAPGVTYAEDNEFAGFERYKEWKRVVWKPFREALDASDPALAEWLDETCSNAAEGRITRPRAPPLPCVVDGMVVCSAFAVNSFLETSSFDRCFASDFALPGEKEKKLPQEEEDERRNRYFSARVLAQVFLAYRIVVEQEEHTASGKDRDSLIKAWVLASAKALTELVRPDDFAVCENLSFAVVCCVVDAEVHKDKVWPASLMTADRVADALRGMKATGTHAESIDFEAWKFLSCLPLVVACNRCAASRDGKNGRPRICTYAPAKDGDAVVSCLACSKNNKSSGCRLQYVTNLEDSEGEEGEEVTAEMSPEERQASDTLPKADPFHSMKAFLAGTKRKASDDFEAGAPKKSKANDKASPGTVFGSIAAAARATPTARMSKKSPSKDKHSARAAAMAGRSRQRSTAAEPDLHMRGLSRDYDEREAATLASAMSRVVSDARASSATGGVGPGHPATPPDAQADYGPLQGSMVEPYRANSTAVGSESIFMPGGAKRAAILALNAASSSGATITVPRVELESLVTFYESMTNLEGMNVVSRAARRGRDAVDAARRTLNENDRGVRSIGAARETLKKLEEDIEVCRRELARNRNGKEKK
ncbi:hypothetical protein EXIGLDRAFT_707403 [Exidia glandulosa HHB12029]|uniref:Uncharacterized protein n=1 Tax=Exidia glandulosa HHB12029 TaxID=1314781 RepID=A0A166NK09_EXIGL|nr:hypothetical protein EXIGLDRAFT_707403 [Exidia glandulosa HHB12029]